MRRGVQVLMQDPESGFQMHARPGPAHPQASGVAAAAAAAAQFLVLLRADGDIKRTPVTPNFYRMTKAGLRVVKVSAGQT